VRPVISLESLRAKPFFGAFVTVIKPQVAFVAACVVTADATENHDEKGKIGNMIFVLNVVCIFVKQQEIFNITK
jgi:hypothetical protein